MRRKTGTVLAYRFAPKNRFLPGVLAICALSAVAMIGCAGYTGASSSQGGVSGSRTLSISTSSLPSGTVGAAYAMTLQASGGATPYSWSLTGGSLPDGLNLNASSGTISGTPTLSGASSFTVHVGDANGHGTSKPLSITIGSSSQRLSITTTSLAGGTVGTAYSATLQATGGATPYSWSLSSGSLPAGLSLSASSGVISGTPTTSGTSTFTVQVKDANSNTASQSLSIAIATRIQPLTITTTSVANGATNTAYSASLFAGGGTTPYTWSLSSGALPAGVTLSSGGDMAGVPTATGTFSFTVKVTDSSLPVQTATAMFSVTITQGAAYSVALTWTASPSAGVTGYNVYRSIISGGYYVKINSTPVSGLSYVDGTALDGTTYYYVLTSVDDAGNESGYSAEVSMVIP